jgi:hypothetical protein
LCGVAEDISIIPDAKSTFCQNVLSEPVAIATSPIFLAEFVPCDAFYGDMAN